MQNEPRILLLDIETKPALIYSFGIRDQHIQHGQIKEDGGTICVGLKWAGERKGYCAQDVRLLEQLYERLKPYIHNHPFTGGGGALQCGACGSQQTQSRGVKRTRSSFIQRYQCMGCGGWFDGKRSAA